MFILSPQALRAAREHAGLSREQLAIAVGRSASTITLYENGLRSPTRAVLMRLAAVLGVTPRSIVEEDPAFQAVAR
jgi:transcriptional regulator with XRE-family HTH domain